MNRSFYFLGVTLTGLFLAMGVFYRIIYFLLGERTIALQSFEDWYIIFNIIYFIVSLILLRYYYIKKYWFTLFAGIILTITSLLHFVIVLNNLEAGELGRYFNVTYSISVGAGILYAISLIFSNAGSRTWLKTAGVFILISQLLQLSVFIWSITSHDIQKKLALAKFQQWTSLASEMILVFFILNY